LPLLWYNGVHNVVSLQTQAGETLVASGVTVTPYSQALTVRLPWGAFVWNWPVAVVVDHGDWVERIPILDLTRLIQLGALGLSLILTLLAVCQRLIASNE
jgi:hypothetical protein